MSNIEVVSLEGAVKSCTLFESSREGVKSRLRGGCPSQARLREAIREIPKKESNLDYQNSNTRHFYFNILIHFYIPNRRSERKNPYPHCWNFPKNKSKNSKREQIRTKSTNSTSYHHDHTLDTSLLQAICGYVHARLVAPATTPNQQWSESQSMYDDDLEHQSPTTSPEIQP